LSNALTLGGIRCWGGLLGGGRSGLCDFKFRGIASRPQFVVRVSGYDFDVKESSIRVWDLSGGLDKAKKLDPPIENHADWVMSVSFSPDGKQLYTGSRDKTAKVWDLAAKESVLTFPDHQQPVTGTQRLIRHLRGLHRDTHQGRPGRRKR
jgi:WD40 repeat protein